LKLSNNLFLVISIFVSDEQHRDEKGGRNQRIVEVTNSNSSTNRRDSEAAAKGSRSTQLGDRDRDRGDRVEVDRGRAVKSSELGPREVRDPRGLSRGAPAPRAAAR